MRKILVPLILLFLMSCGDPPKPTPHDEDTVVVSIEISNIIFGESWLNGVANITDSFNIADSSIYYSFDYGSISSNLEKVWLEWYRGETLFLSTVGVPRSLHFFSTGSFSGVLKNPDGFPSGIYELNVTFLRENVVIEAEITGENSFHVTGDPVK